ncbi:phage tail sheath family protein [Sorangium sp. So ce1182]|uniref:phage tail sheath family protein n=1 Tax=Sorangium sp. So ce1182 TaxID=3133334 RepID=UPI003F609CED
MTSSAHLGAPWRRGLPPGVYEDRPSAARPVEVRLDVAAFVGLTERGPIDRAVPIESFDAYRASFGAPGGGRLLGQSVYLFFANGGRRCVVLRAVAPEAAQAEWVVPGVEIARPRADADVDAPLRSTGSPLRLRARDPGAWGDRLRGKFRFVLRPLGARPSAQHPLPKVALETLAVEVGAVVRLVMPGGEEPVEQFGEVTEIEVDGGGKRIATLSGLPALSSDRVATLEEVRLEMEIAAAEVRERFTDLGLSKEHPRYALDVLRGDPSRPSVGPGSVLVAPAYEPAPAHDAPAKGTPAGGPEPERIVPAEGALARGEHERAWRWEHLAAHGDDAADKTTRRDFFFRHDGGSTLDLLDAYDDANESQPIGCVCMPDLIHPGAAEAIAPVSDPAPPVDPLRFGECVRPAPVEAERPAALYPYLDQSYALLDPPGSSETPALAWQAALVARCEIGRQSGEIDGSAAWGRVAVLDLPPGLAAADVLRWRREVSSARGAAALYAPYLRAAPAEDPLTAPVVVPPCGAAAGIVARRERGAGVHAAPANEVVQGIVGLFREGHLPDAGLLHETHVNLIRRTERGPALLGARTTSEDRDWAHLSVRRLVYWLERQLALDTRWAVFEPNDRILWSRVTRGVERRLSALLSAGALAGASAADSFFVRCSGGGAGAEGRLIIEVGVAPAVPAEFIVFELVQLVDGQISLEERRG